MAAEENLGKQFTKSGKRRHKMMKFTTYGGTNIACEHCDQPVKHPTKTNGLGSPIDMWDYRDKEGMKEAWDAHKEQNP
jgi:hypothetical protein